MNLTRSTPPLLLPLRAWWPPRAPCGMNARPSSAHRGSTPCLFDLAAGNFTFSGANADGDIRSRDVYCATGWGLPSSIRPQSLNSGSALC